MHRYINFTTSHQERTYGNPVHDGKRPRRFHDVAGITIDGEPLEFDDTTIPERVKQYFLSAKQLRRKRIVNDCVAFAASMESIELEDRQHNPFEVFDENVIIHGDTASEIKVPLVLARGYHDGLRIPAHVILPAHLVSGPNFIHKLGDEGPLCMSGLNDAMSIMGCNTAHPALRTES